MKECTYDNIFSSKYTWKQKCIVLEHPCNEKQEFYNFFRLFLCRFDGNIYYIIFFSLFTFYMIFSNICAIVDEYISGSIIHITKWFNMSDAFAGITLLAMANGAGDVITAVVSSGSSEGVSYNIGSLFGAGLFVCTFVMYKTIDASPVEIKLVKETVYRDIVFYILGTLMVIVFGIYGKLTWWTSMLMLLLYVALVIVTVIQDKKKKNSEDGKINSSDSELKSIVNKDTEQNNVKCLHKHCKLQRLASIIRIKIIAPTHFLMQYEAKKEQRLKSFKYLPWYVKLSVIIDFPFVWIRKLIIPPCDDEEYDNYLTMAWPYFGVLAVEMIIKKEFPDSAGWFYYLGFAVLWSIMFWAFGRKYDRYEINKAHLIVCLVGMVVGFIITYYVSGLLIDLLTMIGVLSKLSATYLALTIIAIGNALPDALLTIALAKEKKALLGITGSYAGQLFGLLVGFGIGMLKKSLTEGKPVEFDLFRNYKENIQSIVIVFVMLITLVSTCIYELKNKLQFNKFVGKMLIFIYISFILLATILEIGMKFLTKKKTFYY